MQVLALTSAAAAAGAGAHRSPIFLMANFIYFQTHGRKLSPNCASLLVQPPDLNHRWFFPHWQSSLGSLDMGQGVHAAARQHEPFWALLKKKKNNPLRFSSKSRHTLQPRRAADGRLRDGRPAAHGHPSAR